MPTMVGVFTVSLRKANACLMAPRGTNETSLSAASVIILTG